jgi:hypothetical protein
VAKHSIVKNLTGVPTSHRCEYCWEPATEENLAVKSEEQCEVRTNIVDNAGGGLE